MTIAEELFHDANLAWLLADLNKESIKETWDGSKRIIELHTRQQIQLPVWQDIVEFYQNRPDKSSPDNLVTVVTNTQLDRELVDSSLAVVMGASSVVSSPFMTSSQAKITHATPASWTDKAELEIPALNYRRQVANQISQDTHST